MNFITTRSLLILAGVSVSLFPCAASAMSSADKPTQTSARTVTPTIHPMRRSNAKSNDPGVLKPAAAPRRKGPVLKLDAELDHNGKLQLHCHEQSTHADHDQASSEVQP